MNEKISREKIVKLLSELTDVKIQARKELSQGIDAFEADDQDQVLLTRQNLEELIESQPNINIYAFHSSGINNAGNHSSS